MHRPANSHKFSIFPKPLVQRMKFLVVASTFFLIFLVSDAAAEEANHRIRGQVEERDLKKNKPVNVPKGKAIGWWCCKPLKAGQCADWEALKSAECANRISGSNFQGCAVVNNKCDEVKP